MAIFRTKNSVKWPFGQMTFRSNDLSVKWLFFEKAFGQMYFRSNELSVKWPYFEKSFRSNEFSVKCHFGHLTSFSNLIFGQMTLFQIFSDKRPLDKFCFRPNDFFRSNELSVKRRSVKWYFGQMAFRSNGVRPNGVRSNGVSVKRRSVKKNRLNDFSVKWSRTTHMDQFSKNCISQKL
jgi:hypothetical protein